MYVEVKAQKREKSQGIPEHKSLVMPVLVLKGEPGGTRRTTGKEDRK